MKMTDKRTKEILRIAKKYGFKQVIEPPKEMVKGLNPFTGKGKKLFDEAIIFDKDERVGCDMLLFDIELYKGESKYPKHQSYHLLVLDIESDMLGTLIQGGEVISEKLTEIYNNKEKLLPLHFTLFKGKAWNLQQVK